MASRTCSICWIVPATSTSTMRWAPRVSGRGPGKGLAKLLAETLVYFFTEAYGWALECASRYCMPTYVLMILSFHAHAGQVLCCSSCLGWLHINLVCELSCPLLPSNFLPGDCGNAVGGRCAAGGGCCRRHHGGHGTGSAAGGAGRLVHHAHD